MKTMQYVVMTQTIEPTNGFTYVVAMVGVFDDLNMAIEIANREIKRMGAPDMYTLLPYRRQMLIPTDEKGMYVNTEEKTEFAIAFSVLEAEQNRVYTVMDKLM